jgi:hypothetical protein
MRGEVARVAGRVAAITVAAAGMAADTTQVADTADPVTGTGMNIRTHTNMATARMATITGPITATGHTITTRRR